MIERDPILNGGTDPDSSSRRSGSSVNDPHGGHEYHGHELESPEADPVDELVPGGQGGEPAAARPLPLPPATTMATEAGHASDDLGAHVPNPGGDNWPSNVEPAMDPTSPTGLRHEGMAEGGTAVEPSSDWPTEPLDDAAPTLSAYTANQKPNLPSPINEEMGRQAQGSGVGQEPVERRANLLVFDEDAGNFQVKDEEHTTGVTSQDHDQA